MSNIVASACPHRSVIVVTTGGMHFSAGEAWDDIQEVLLCLDCMEHIPEADLRSTEPSMTSQAIPLEITHDHA